MVALMIATIVLQGSGRGVDADVVQSQLAAPSPEFLRYSTSAQIKGGVESLELVPSPVDRSHLDGEHINSLGSDTPLPTSYDLRTDGRVTAVRTQGSSSACWTFATYGSLESTMLPARTMDFSENNLKNASGFDYGANSGGNGDMSTAYLVRWSGPIAEADDPYDQKSTTSPANLNPIGHVQNVMILPRRPGPLDTADIKRAIVDYGAVAGSMYWAGNQRTDTTYYKLNTSAYYYSGSDGINHSVTVVGWNDAFPVSNFSTPPSGDGAWIVKNSWGIEWGQSGYFFISYYDSVLFKNGSAYCFQAAEPTTNYAHVYQYDPLGHTSSVGYGATTAWEANVFVAADTENVSAVGFYTLDANCSYEATVYSSWHGSEFSKPSSSTTGTIPSPGYHTVVLPSFGASVTSGQTFGVVIKLTTTNDLYPIALEKPIAGYSMGATASTGQSYMSPDGVSWTDVAGEYANTNVCVKAYTVAPPAKATLTWQASPAETGFVSASPPSVDNTYYVGTVVTLIAAPALGWKFAGWIGATPDADDPLKATATMDADKTVTATFQLNPPPAVALSSPANGATVSTSTAMLSWNSASGAISYNVALDTSSSFTTPVTWNVSTTSQTTSTLVENTTYYWRVASVNAGGSSPWSPVFSFTTRKPQVTLTLTLQLGDTRMLVSGSDGTSDTVTLDAAPVLGTGDRTLVPVRAMAEAMGGTVGWDPVTKTATVTVGSNMLELTLGKNTALFNGTATPIDTDPKVLPMIINGRTMLPLRFVVESLGAEVSYDRATETITIIYAKS
jgi:C1A family cysteine protease